MDLDEALARLATFEPPNKLAQVEQRVLVRLADASPLSRRAPAGLSAFALFGALAMGVAAGVLPGKADANSSTYPLDGGAALAPSALLAPER